VPEFIFSIVAAIRVFLRSRGDTALEVLALRQRVAVLKRKRPLLVAKTSFNSAGRRINRLGASCRLGTEDARPPYVNVKSARMAVNPQDPSLSQVVSQHRPGTHGVLASHTGAVRAVSLDSPGSRLKRFPQPTTAQVCQQLDLPWPGSDALCKSVRLVFASYNTAVPRTNCTVPRRGLRPCSAQKGCLLPTSRSVTASCSASARNPWR